jgi:hypothetical protein
VNKYLEWTTAAVGAALLAMSIIALYNRFTLDPRESLIVAMMVAGIHARPAPRAVVDCIARSDAIATGVGVLPRVLSCC